MRRTDGIVSENKTIEKLKLKLTDFKVSNKKLYENIWLKSLYF